MVNTGIEYTHVEIARIPNVTMFYIKLLDSNPDLFAFANLTR